MPQSLKKEEDKCIYNNVAYHSKGSKVNTWGSHVVCRPYRLKNDNMSLPDYYPFTKSTTD